MSIMPIAQDLDRLVFEDDFTDEQRELYELMSEISEDCYCAGWMIGLEHAIWGALQDGDRRYGMGVMDEVQLEKVRALSKKLNGWIVWIDDDDAPGLPIDKWGARFIPMDEWLQLKAEQSSVAIPLRDS